MALVIDTYANSNNVRVREFNVNPWEGGGTNNTPTAITSKVDEYLSTHTINLDTTPIPKDYDDSIYCYTYFPNINSATSNWVFLDLFNVLYAVGSYVPIVEEVDPETLIRIHAPLTFGGAVGPISGYKKGAIDNNKFYLTDASQYNAAALRSETIRGSDLLSNVPGAVFLDSRDYSPEHNGPHLFRIRNAHTFVSTAAIGSFMRFFEGLLRDNTYEPRGLASARYDSYARLRSNESSHLDPRSVVTRGEMAQDILGQYILNKTLTFAARSATARIALDTMDPEFQLNTDSYYTVVFNSQADELTALRDKVITTGVEATEGSNPGAILFSRSQEVDTARSMNVTIFIVASPRSV